MKLRKQIMMISKDLAASIGVVRTRSNTSDIANRPSKLPVPIPLSPDRRTSLQVNTADNKQCGRRSDIRPSPITQSQEASIGTCTICRRENIRIINTTGLLWNHGPRENPCSGSRTRPQFGSIHISTATRVKTRLPICTVTNGTATVDDDSRVTPAPPSQMDLDR